MTKILVKSIEIRGCNLLSVNDSYVHTYRQTLHYYNKVTLFLLKLQNLETIYLYLLKITIVIECVDENTL